MLRRCLTTGVTFAFLFALTLPLFAGEIELQYQVTDLRGGVGYTNGQYLRPGLNAQETLSAEPKYRSKIPLYILAKFGDGEDNKYTIVLDESKGTGRGYDVLYPDRNNNEDLTDDRGIVGQVHQRDRYSTTGNFGPIEVMVDYEDRTMPYYFSVEYSRYNYDGIQQDARMVRNMSLRLKTSGYYTGIVPVDESERRIAVIDFNCNGLFNDYFKPHKDIRRGGGGFYADGDKFLMDVNADGQFDSGESYPYAKYIQVDGKWRCLDITAHGSQVEVQTPQIKLGTIKIPSQLGSGSIQILSENGVMKLPETEQEFQIPVGAYQVYAHTAQVKHSSGEWRYDTMGTSSGEKIQVTEDSVSTLPVGPPILVDVSYSSRTRRGGEPKAGDMIELSVAFSGQGGEVYTNIQGNGQRPPAPTFKVVDEAGKTVAKGAFKYG